VESKELLTNLVIKLVYWETVDASMITIRWSSWWILIELVSCEKMSGYLTNKPFEVAVIVKSPLVLHLRITQDKNTKTL